MKNIRVRRATHGLKATLAFPGDKSLSHRAIIFGALAEGVSSFTNVLAGEDCVCTRRAFEALGVTIRSPIPSEITIDGVGLRGLRQAAAPLYLGNSGTSMRLLCGILAGQPFETVLAGDPSLSSRPMRRVTGPLRRMGASIEGRDDANYAPLTVKGGPLRAAQETLPVASAQVKSALLLAGLYAPGVTSVTEPEKSRDHTERFLAYFGADVREDGLTVSVRGGQERPLHARSFAIAGDISSAAFFIAMGLLVPGSELAFRSVLWNPTRIGLVTALKKMGVELVVDALHAEGPERKADLMILSRPLGPLDLARADLASLIDEVPVLAVLATQARGTSFVREASELRVKETDRIRSMTEALGRMGANVRADGDTLVIDGPTPLHGARVDSFKDHRTAMAAVVAGLVADGETVVEDIDCINTSFPTFFDLLRRVGADFEVFES